MIELGGLTSEGAPVGAHGGFAIEHQAEPFIATEIGGIVLFSQATAIPARPRACI
jgi:hypothetical protein